LLFLLGKYFLSRPRLELTTPYVLSSTGTVSDARATMNSSHSTLWTIVALEIIRETKPYSLNSTAIDRDLSLLFLLPVRFIFGEPKTKSINRQSIVVAASCAAPLLSFQHCSHGILQLQRFRREAHVRSSGGGKATKIPRETW